MNTIKIEHGKAKMIAHRGLCGIEKENTNAAFIAAGNRSYWGIETDVYRTCDGHFVICHDATPKRVSGDWLDIEKSTYDAVRSLKLYDRKGDRKRNDLCIPDLEEYADTCVRYDKHSVVEFKSAFTAEELEQIVEMMRQKGQLSRTTFISFQYDTLKRLRAILPDQPCQFLTDRPADDALLQRLAEDHFGLDIEYHRATKELIDRVHAIGQAFNVWICNDPDAAKQMIEWGVDYITSNILE